MNGIVNINHQHLSTQFDQSVLDNINYPTQIYQDHLEIADKLENKNPYTVTVLIESLGWNLWRRKEYTKQERTPAISRYRELLYQLFFDEFGEREGNEIYAKWLSQYRPLWEKEGRKKEIDEYIVDLELEKRYLPVITKRYKNIETLKKPRFRIERERYYHLPEPLNHVDWRNPYDNIFIWHIGNGQKLAVRGGSGSSGGRERNSKFIFGLSLINQKHHVPSFLFIYSSKNELFFIRKFPSFCIPEYDIGCNYFLQSEEEEKILKGAKFLRWSEFWKIDKVVISNA